MQHFFIKKDKKRGSFSHVGRKKRENSLKWELLVGEVLKILGAELMLLFFFSGLI